MKPPRPHAGRDPWTRWSVVALVALTLVALLVGFVVLPSAQRDFTAQGLWAGICRAAGVPAAWGRPGVAATDPGATQVVLLRSMAAPATSEAIGRGATLALNCTMCHGARGASESNAPNLAGQYPEVVIKQMHDFRTGRRQSPVMEALAQQRSDRDIDDLAAYFASLPQARTAPTTYDESLPALVRVGAPLRNIAPCIACHGGTDQKLGAPWIEGMPKDYLVQQLQAFRAGTRRNDIEGQMRNVARAMTDAEIDAVATFYARKQPATPEGAATR